MSDPTQLQRRIEALTRIAEPDPAQVQAFAERMFRYETPDGHVTATVNGGSELLGLDVMVTATRGAAREVLGDRVVEAVNGALRECAQARREEFGLGGAADLAAKADAFAERMDRTAADLDALRGSLYGRLDEIQRLYRPGGGTA